MRLVTVTSIGALVVSIAVLVFVLGLYAELEKSEPSAVIEPTSVLTKCEKLHQQMLEARTEPAALYLGLQLMDTGCN